MKIVLTAFLAGLLMIGCHSKPKVVEQVQTSEPATAVAASEEMHVHSEDEAHDVVVQEVLQAERYTYMNVSEDGEVYWIAVPKQNVEVGARYLFQGGLKKVNFRSTEFDRMFETIFLVSRIARAPADGGTSALDQAMARIDVSSDADQDIKVTPAGDGVSLKELFENREKYAGKTIKVKGRCVKINKNIMGRNWVHIRDGSDPDRDYDLTVTTMVDVPVGAVVEFEGQITLNKDFGAGYRYDVIMEDGHVH